VQPDEALGAGELRGQVRIAHVAAQGIREAVLETDTNLLVLEAAASQAPRQDGLWVNAVEDLLVDPPCDVALVRPDTTPIRSVLVPVRGGPSAQLALRLAATVCKETGAELLLFVFGLLLFFFRLLAEAFGLGSGGATVLRLSSA